MIYVKIIKYESVEMRYGHGAGEKSMEKNIQESFFSAASPRSADFHSGLCACYLCADRGKRGAGHRIYSIFVIGVCIDDYSNRNDRCRALCTAGNG